MERKDIMKTVRYIRMQKGYALETMAAELGISASAYSKIERGETNASMERILQIVNALSISIYDLLYAVELVEQGKWVNLVAEASARYSTDCIKSRMEALETENARLLAMISDKDDVIRMYKSERDNHDDDRN